MRDIKVEEHTPNDDKCRDMPNMTLFGTFCGLIADGDGAFRDIMWSNRDG